MNNNTLCGIILIGMLGFMMYAMGIMADKQIERMEKENSGHELNALITK